MNELQMPNLLLIAGTGRKTGKTTLACTLITAFSVHTGLIAVKISSHLHVTDPGPCLASGPGHFSVSIENDPHRRKDSSRMLRAGAARVFYIQASGEALPEAFQAVLPEIPGGVPVICESGGLRDHVVPGVFLFCAPAAAETWKPGAEKNAQKADRILNFDEQIAVSRDLVFEGGVWRFCPSPGGLCQK